MYLVHFAERLGGSLATFTIVDLIANTGYAKVPVLPWPFSDVPFVT